MTSSPSCHRRSLSDHMRLDELVALAGGVRFLDRFACARRRDAFAFDDRAPRSLDSLPSAVAIHRVVAPDHRRDSPMPKLLQLRFELIDKRQRRARRLVAPVEHRVNRDPLCAISRGDVEDSHQVVDVTVHTSVRKQPPDMQRRAVSDGLFDRIDNRRVACEGAALDRLRNPHQVLVDDAARSDRKMPDFGIAHHPRRQAHRFARRIELSMRLRRVEAIHHRRLRRCDRVRPSALADPPPVENYQRCNRRPCGHQDFPRLVALAPGYVALAPSSSAILISRLYFALRSDRLSDPVLICPVPVATTRSAIVVSSVSPER